MALHLEAVTSRPAGGTPAPHDAWSSIARWAQTHAGQWLPTFALVAVLSVFVLTLVVTLAINAKEDDKHINGAFVRLLSLAVGFSFAFVCLVGVPRVGWGAVTAGARSLQLPHLKSRNSSSK